MDREDRVVVLYKNWKGKTDKRVIIPIKSYWGHTEFHTEDQFLLECYDVEKEANRTYAMKDIIKIESVGNHVGAVGLTFN